MSIFEELSAINVNEHTEKKNKLTYLSWSWAWAELMKRHPDAEYSIREWDGKPYLYDEDLGYLCMVSIKIGDTVREMWLPVMDGANKAMKNHSYQYDTKFGKKTCEAATMFDINTTIMRCLVKCIALFGLGLYIYAGEDLPESEEPKKEEPKKPTKVKKADDLFGTVYPSRFDVEKEILGYYKDNEANYRKALQWAGVDSIDKIPSEKLITLYNQIKGKSNE